MFKTLEKFSIKPKLYEQGTDGSFWTDPHISTFLLEAHLNPQTEASSRNPDYMDISAKWISEVASPNEHPSLLDLGCGAGLYAERFANLGYNVTGFDFSERSINYAKGQNLKSQSKIDYFIQDYLTFNETEKYDVITLIYCDYGALSTTNRKILLKNVQRALKPNGKFILDVFSLQNFDPKHETKTWTYYADGGFWNKDKHLCLDSNYLYPENATELRQSIIMTDTTTQCYNVWEHYFSKESFLTEIESKQFKLIDLYADISGNTYVETSDTLCGVFEKTNN